MSNLGAKLALPRGFVIKESETIEAARLAIREDRPDVVFLDLNVGGMNGAAAIDEIATTNPDAKIIISTAMHREAPMVLNALSQGAHAYLRKPFRMSETREALVSLELLRNEDMREHPKK